MTSYLHTNALSQIVRDTLAYSSKHLSHRDDAVTRREFHRSELQEDESQRRLSISYEFLIGHEALWIKFRQRLFAKYQPRRPDDDDDDDLLGRTRSDSVCSFSSIANSSTTSTVFDQQTIAAMQEAGHDAIDIEIELRLQHRERAGKRRLRFQKATDHSWSTVKKSAPFDSLLDVERGARMDIEDIEEEFLDPKAVAFTSHPLTRLAALQTDEARHRRDVYIDETDDSAELIKRCYNDIDVPMEEMQIGQAIEAASVARARVAAALQEIDDAASFASATAAAPGRVKMAAGVVSDGQSPPAAGFAKCPSDNSSLSSQLSGVPPPPREPMGTPQFTSNIFGAPRRRPSPPPPPKSDHDILLEMKVRKERYAREGIQKFEEIERSVVVAQCRQDETLARIASRDNAYRKSQVPTFVPGSVEERLAYAHRVDMRPPRR